MDNSPVYYTAEQTGIIERYLDDKLGPEDNGAVMHEHHSDYVHTDVYIREYKGKGIVFTTVGMGARKMKVPDGAFGRIELVMFGSTALCMDPDDPEIKKIYTVCSELVKLSKYPFANDTWLGRLHTINASDKFAAEFGYRYFLLSPHLNFAYLSDNDAVCFLKLIPIYEKEREWIISNEDGSRRFSEAFYELMEIHGKRMYFFDEPRELIIPRDENVLSC